MKCAEIVDGAASGHLLVFGSLPPDGRDLDLLVRSEHQKEIEGALAKAGFLQRGTQWVRFEGCSAEALDIVPAGGWGLAPEALDDLYAKARKVEGYNHLVEPAPHHSLLILARRMVLAGGELDHKRRERVRRALTEDFAAWERAQQVAHGWSSGRAALALERLYKTGVPISRRVRAAALSERGGGSIGARVHAWRTVLVRRRGRGLVAFSGLDGSGKSTQAEALKETLERVRGDTVIVWTRLSYNPSLKMLAKPAKVLLNRRRTSSNGETGVVDAIDLGTELRRKNPAVTQGWATMVAVANAVSQARLARYHLRRGRFVVCDRYTLDSRVHLRYRYGTQQRFGLQARIINTLSPRPIRAYLVEVPPPVANQRKAEQYDLDQLGVQARLYAEEGDGLDTKRIDGTRPKDELCEEVAEDVWRALAQPKPSWRSRLHLFDVFRRSDH